MSLTEDQVKKVAFLARLEISPEEIPLHMRNLSNIFEFIASIDKAEDIKRVEPMAHPLELKQVLRKDVVTEPNLRELLLSIAPLIERGLYLVPPFIEE